MGVQHRIARALAALLPARYQVRPPMPRRPVTTLAPLPVLVTAPATAHPDMSLIMTEWNAHLRHKPRMTWPEFLRILEGRDLFFGEERREREAKLAKLTAVPRFTL